MSGAEREALREALDRADTAVDDLCRGRLRWEMRVPAEPDHDPDLIISHALGLARAALAAEAADTPEPQEPGLDAAKVVDECIYIVQQSIDTSRAERDSNVILGRSNDWTRHSIDAREHVVRLLESYAAALRSRP
jgi:hypothetical protein